MVFHLNKKILVTVLLFAVFFLIGCDTFIISPFIPLISKTLNVAAGTSGYLVTAYSLFYVLVSIFMGPLSDMIGRKKMILVGMAVFALASIATGLTSVFAITLVARALTGAGAAFAAPNVWSYIGDYFSDAERSKVTAVIASALSLGMIIGVPAGSALAQFMSWQQAFYVLGSISIVVVVLILAFLPMSGSAVNKQNYFISFKKVFLQRNIVFSFLTTFFVAFANFGLYTFLGYWLNKTFKLNTSMSGLFLIIAGVGNLIGMQLAGVLSNKVGKKKFVSISTLIMVASLFILSFSSFNIILAGIDVFVWLAAGGASFAIMQVIVTQLSSSSRGTVMSLNNSFMWAGTASGSAIVGITINGLTFFVSTLICSVAALSASLIIRIFVVETNKIISNQNDGN